MLTGAINLSVDTLKVGRVGAMGILGGYMFVVSLVAAALYYKRLRIKL